MFQECQTTLRLAGPVMGAQFLQFGMVLTDNIMVGRLGPSPLAAMAMATALFSFIFIFSIGILSALSPLVSQAHGAKDDARIGPVTRQGLRICLALSVVIIFAFKASPPLLHWLKQEPQLIPVAKAYLDAVCWGIPAALGYLCLRQLTEGVLDTKPSLLIALIGLLLNIVADYALIFGNLGLPRLEVVGAGYATAIISWAMFLAMLLYILVRPTYKKFGLFRPPFKTEWRTIGEILRLGLPLGGIWVCEVGFFVTNTLLMGTIGTLELAAHQVAINAASFTFMIPLGLSIGVSIRVGHYIGEKNWSGVRRGGNAGFILAFLFMSLSAFCFLVFPAQITRIYSNDVQLLEITVQFLMIAGAFQLFDGLQVVGVGALRGLKDTRVPLLATIVSYWLMGLPFGYFIAFHTAAGPQGLWWGMVLGLSTAALLHFSRFRWLTPPHRLLKAYGNE